MACEQNSSRISRLACQIGVGISALASKRSFYAGVAVGAAGTAGAMAVAKALRRSASPRSVAIQTQPLPAGGITVGGTRVNSLQISKGDLMAAKNRPGARDNPIQLSKEGLEAARSTSLQSGTRANPRPVPILGAAPTPPPETKLRPGSLRMRTSSGQTFITQNSYRVVRSDGSDTGLAITPYFRQAEDGQYSEDQNAWGVTHAGSGSLISGPYDNVAHAQGLATRLSPLPWTAPVVPSQDVEQARQIIKTYQQSAEEGQA